MLESEPIVSDLESFLNDVDDFVEKASADEAVTEDQEVNDDAGDSELSDEEAEEEEKGDEGGGDGEEDREHDRPEITDEDRLRAHKLANEAIEAMEIERKNQLINRELDRCGFFGAMLLSQRTIRKVEEEGKYWATAEMRDMMEEYALQLITRQQITASGNEVYELMQQYNGQDWFNLDPVTGTFETPRHPDSNNDLWSQLVRNVQGNNRDNTRVRGTGGLAGMGLVAGIRAGLENTITGVLGSVGGGIIAGGILGYLRGRRESTEATSSAESWLAEINAALDTGLDAKIEVACHKVQRIFRDEATRNEFFNGRTRYETVLLLQKFQEGMRRLAMGRMAREAAVIPPNATEKERKQAVASLFHKYCEQMSDIEEERIDVSEQITFKRKIANEEAFERQHGDTYRNAFAAELGIVTADPNFYPQNPNYDATQEQQGTARWAVLSGFNRHLGIRREKRARMLRGNIIVGAITGGVAGGVGFMLGDWLIGAYLGQGTPEGYVENFSGNFVRPENVSGFDSLVEIEFDGNREAAIASLLQNQATRDASNALWPGWLYLAGGALVGAGHGIDVSRRNSEINETIRQQNVTPIAPPLDSPYRVMGYDIKDFYKAPEPDQRNIEIRRNEKVVGNLRLQIAELENGRKKLINFSDAQLESRMTVPPSKRSPRVDIITSDQMQNILNELSGFPGDISGPVDAENILQELAARIRQEREVNAYPNQTIINQVIQAQSSNELWRETYFKRMFKREEVREMFRINRNAQNNRDELEQWLGQWDASRAEDAFNAWNALRAKRRIERLNEIIENRRQRVDNLRQQQQQP